MSFSDRLSDATGANQLNVQISLITNAQAWTRQVRGTYSLIYAHAQADFLHLEDFNQFLQNIYAPHTHGNGNNGSPTTSVIEPAVVSNTEAQALLEAGGALGKIRTGISDASRSIDFIDKTNAEDLG
jgi:hypothetical protein